MSNVIQFPMDRVRPVITTGTFTTSADDFFFALSIADQEMDLEVETARILDQAKAIEEQSQRVLDLMTDLENY
jgi:hypothetical protein